jgi:probable HAF family extracellular repeat protein
MRPSAADGWTSQRATDRKALPILLRIEPLESRCLLSYTITDLGTLGGSESLGFALNNSGQAAGISRIAGDEFLHAFLYSGGSMIDLGTLGNYPNSASYAVNDAGHVVGTSRDAFLYDGSSLTDLGTLGGGGSSAFAVNQSDEVVGYSTIVGDADWHAFLYAGGVMKNLGTFGGQYSVANGINDNEEVVGYAQLANGNQHAFYYNQTVGMLDLGTLGGAQSFALGINNVGQVVGFSETADGQNHVFVYTGGVMIDLGISTPGNWLAINNYGQVVGLLSSGHPFLYTDGVVNDLNDLLPDGSGWVLNDARGINDAGQIVGYGVIGNQTHAFLMTLDDSPARHGPTPGLPPSAGELAWLAGAGVPGVTGVSTGTALVGVWQLSAGPAQQPPPRSATPMTTAAWPGPGVARLSVPLASRPQPNPFADWPPDWLEARALVLHTMDMVGEH